MFYHMRLIKKEIHTYKGAEYEIVIYGAEEDGHLRGYISSGGFSDRIAEMPSEVATDMRVTSNQDPVQMMLNIIKSEIDAGKFPTPS